MYHIHSAKTILHYDGDASDLSKSLIRPDYHLQKMKKTLSLIKREYAKEMEALIWQENAV